MKMEKVLIEKRKGEKNKLHIHICILSRFPHSLSISLTSLSDMSYINVYVIAVRELFNSDPFFFASTRISLKLFNVKSKILWAVL